MQNTLRYPHLYADLARTQGSVFIPSFMVEIIREHLVDTGEVEWDGEPDERGNRRVRKKA